MTTLSQLLAAEEPDLTEDVSFYLPGQDRWGSDETTAILLRRRTASKHEDIYFTDEGIYDE